MNEDFVKFLEKKIVEEFNVDEWASKTLEEFRAVDTVKCVICGFDKTESDMLKIFKTWTNGQVSANTGICKRCWSFDPNGDEV